MGSLVAELSCISWDDALDVLLTKEASESGFTDLRALLMTLVVSVNDMNFQVESLPDGLVGLEPLRQLNESIVLIQSMMLSVLITSPACGFGPSEYETHQPLQELLSLLRAMEKEALLREALKKMGPDAAMQGNKVLERLSANDKNLVLAYCTYLKLLVILMCIKESPYYSDSTKSIAAHLLSQLMSVFANCRIEKLYLECNISHNEAEAAPRSTTKLEFFFVQSNGDRYCLRIDFPHNDIEYVHFNFHEPGRANGNTSHPISQEVYKSLEDAGLNDLSDYFYHNGNYYWFKSDYLRVVESSVEEGSESERALKDVFEENGHVQILPDGTSQDDINEFLELFCEAIAVYHVPNSAFERIKEVEPAKELHILSKKEYIREATYVFARLFIEEKLDPEWGKKLNKHVRSMLSPELKTQFGVDSCDEIEGLSLDELICLWLDIVEES